MTIVHGAMGKRFNSGKQGKLPTLTPTQRKVLVTLRDHPEPWLSLGKRRFADTIPDRGYFIRPDIRIDKRTVRKLYGNGYIKADEWVRWDNGHDGYHAKAVITERGKAALEKGPGRGKRP